MADEVKNDTESRIKAGFERVAAEINAVRTEMTTGGQTTSADKVSYNGKTVQQALDDLNYKPISIDSFTNTVNTAEKGSTVDAVTLNWTLNKTPTALTLDGNPIDVQLLKQDLTKLGLKANKTWTLSATDDRKASSTKTTSVSFLNGVYYGLGDVGADGVTNEFIQGLTKILSGNAKREYNLTVDAGKYAYIAYPDSFGDVTPNIGGFDGGMGVIKTFDYTNPSGFTEPYRVLRTTNAGLGKVTIVLK